MVEKKFRMVRDTITELDTSDFESAKKFQKELFKSEEFKDGEAKIVFLKDFRYPQARYTVALDRKKMKKIRDVI